MPPGDTESKILLALSHMETRVLERIGGVEVDLAEVKGTVIRVEERQAGFMSQCRIKHDSISGEEQALRGRVENLEAARTQSDQHKVELLEKNVQSHKESRTWWTRTIIAAIVSLMAGSGGLMILQHVFH